MRTHMVSIKILIIYFISVFLCFFISYSDLNSVGGDVLPKEGWINENIFRCAGSGSPDPNLVQKDQRRESSRRAALESVQRRTLEMFTGERLSSGTGDEYDPVKGREMRLFLRGLVMQGSIVQEQYDSKDNCTIVYEIRRERLKRAVIYGE